RRPRAPPVPPPPPARPTTLALMRLVSEGSLALEATVSSFLPKFAGGHKDQITVRDLLAHRGGLHEWWPLYMATARIGVRPQVALDVVDRLPLRYPPQEGYHYSDLGFIQLGRIVSAVAGEPLPAAVRSLIFTPLGLPGIAYGPCPSGPVSASAPDDRVEIEMIDSGAPYLVPYTSADFPRWRRTTIMGQVHDGNAFHALGGTAGHAGLFATVPDLLDVATALARYVEHEEIWRPTVAEEFFAGRRDPYQALGFRRYPMRLGGHPVDALGHPGFVGAAFAFVPGSDVAVALGTNRLLHGGPPVPTELLLRDLLATATSVAAGSAAFPGTAHPPDTSRGPS
ncbi:MAG: beta-lactamase family protein, partial [Phycicoccus sp.]|nr:beta-lactamase family protein [Phycicoccus sp.]